ncbi:hypothetical protein DLM75_06250 [Leptospira stimsonii]|uniref:Uncharacterized protein n=1 Tax=Leptospira stimsonii TaxID=2202203 RepID=A0A396ZH06_9LEPT|nr:hypothetical protein DLM75_06250 [Leptospira stimsonii]
MKQSYKATPSPSRCVQKDFSSLNVGSSRILLSSERFLFSERWEFPHFTEFKRISILRALGVPTFY